MSDEEKQFIGLHSQEIGDGEERYGFLLVEGEQVEAEYKSVRDRLVFTNKRIIAINVQGITGRKTEYLVVPYKEISAFAVESAGTLDVDSEFRVWASGIGLLQFEFLRSDVKKIAGILSRGCL